MHVHVKLLNWTYLNFDLKLLESTPMYIIEQKIKERHGGAVQKLSLWKEDVMPKNRIKDFSQTLKQVFMFNDSMVMKKITKTVTTSNPPPVATTPTATTITVDAETKLETITEANMNSFTTPPNITADESTLNVSLAPNNNTSYALVNKSITQVDEVEYECIIYYDYQPFETNCPLLLSSPRLVKVFSDEELQWKKSAKK